VHDASPANFGTAATLACKLITASTGYTREAYLGFDSVRNHTPAGRRLAAAQPDVSGHRRHPRGANGRARIMDRIRAQLEQPSRARGPAISTWLPALSSRTSSDVLAAVLSRSGGSLDFNVTTRAPTFDGFVNYASRENPDASLRPALDLVLPRPELEIWRIDRFGAESNNPSLAGNDADPDADGESNLYEFATGQNPHRRISAPSTPWHSRRC
jgi:hypothetical protein